MSGVKDFVRWLLYVWAFTIGAAGMVLVAGLPIWFTLYFLYWAFA